MLGTIPVLSSSVPNSFVRRDSAFRKRSIGLGRAAGKGGNAWPETDRRSGHRPERQIPTHVEGPGCLRPSRRMTHSAAAESRPAVTVRNPPHWPPLRWEALSGPAESLREDGLVALVHPSGMWRPPSARRGASWDAVAGAAMRPIAPPSSGQSQVTAPFASRSRSAVQHAESLRDQPSCKHGRSYQLSTCCPRRISTALERQTPNLYAGYAESLRMEGRGCSGGGSAESLRGAPSDSTRINESLFKSSLSSDNGDPTYPRRIPTV